jgi:hypothetical protein
MEPTDHMPRCMAVAHPSKMPDTTSTADHDVDLETTEQETKEKPPVVAPASDLSSSSGDEDEDDHRCRDHEAPTVTTTIENGTAEKVHQEEEDDDDDDDDDDDEQDGTLHIPQRYTKSGRKRSTPFPVRVRWVGGMCANIMWMFSHPKLILSLSLSL